MGDDDSGCGYTSPPPCLVDLTTPLDQQHDDAEIQLFKASKFFQTFVALVLTHPLRPCSPIYFVQLIRDRFKRENLL
jgi:hypothetical protein